MGPRCAFRRSRALAAGAGLAALLAAACGSEEAPDARSQTPSATTVEIQSVEPDLLRNVVEIPGQLTAGMTVEIKPEVEGVIASIHFAEGQAVAEGDVLIRLRDAEQNARLQEAEAQLALAEAVYRRTRNLARRDVSSAAQLERASAEREVARARVEFARVTLNQTYIRAAFDGVMGELEVAPGDRVETDQELVRIDAVDRLQLRFMLPEIAIGAVRPGVPVEIRVAPFGEERFHGEVYFVSPSLDPASRNILIKAWVPNPDHRLRPGLFAQIDAEIERRENALLVPESALIYAVDGTYVWRVDAEQQVERVPVEVGLRSGDRVEIREGLLPGDRIVSAGIHKVQPGGRVRAAGEPVEPAAPVVPDVETEQLQPAEVAPSDAGSRGET